MCSGALRALGHPHALLGLYDNLDLIRQKIAAFQPDVIFNILDCFKGNSALDQHICVTVGIAGSPVRSCGALGLTLSKHKGIAKQILGYHRIRVPQFALFPPWKEENRPGRDGFAVSESVHQANKKRKPPTASPRASFAETDEQLTERVAFIHGKIPARTPSSRNTSTAGELYVSVLGNDRLCGSVPDP